MKLLLTLIPLLTLMWATAVPAQDNPALAAKKEQVKKLLESLQWKTGNIPVGGDKAVLDLQPGYRYLNPGDTNKVLSNLWGNPPSTTWGVIFPPNSDPLNYPWAMIVEGFEDEGYVKDEDADKLDASKILSELQEGQKEANKARAQKGYAELEITGWAAKPHYDKEAKKLTWAIDLKVAGSDEHNINYYVRVLGRRGFLVLNIIADNDSIPVIDKELPQVLSMVNFNEGHRYADFNPKTDKVAAYGIAGLIAAGIGIKLLKVGFFAAFFKPIIAFALAAKKLVVVAVLGIGAFIKKLFGRKNDQTT